MTIRQMKADDYGKVYALWLSCKGMGLNSVDDSREGIEKFLSANPETCFVAVSGEETPEKMTSGEEILGCILIGTDGRRGYIYHLAVSPAHRKQGIGKALVETGLEACRKIGISKTALVAFRRNEEGNLFWSRIGFTIRDDLFYRDVTLAQMERIETTGEE